MPDSKDTRAWPALVLRAGLLFAALFALGTWVLTLPELAGFDAAVAARLGAGPEPPLRVPMLDITALGSAPVVTLVAVLGTALLWTAERRFEAIWLAVASAGGGLLVRLSKLAFDRERPEAATALADYAGTSFPSGHTLMATALYLTLACIAARGAAPATRRALFAAALLLALLVAASRVYLRVHFPSDVIAGLAFGTAWAWFAARAADLAFRRD